MMTAPSSGPQSVPMPPSTIMLRSETDRGNPKSVAEMKRMKWA